MCFVYCVCFYICNFGKIMSIVIKKIKLSFVIVMFLVILVNVNINNEIEEIIVVVKLISYVNNVIEFVMFE